MKAVEPKKGIGNEEGADFGATVVEYAGLPIGMPSLARVAVLVEAGAVKLSQAVGVARKVRGHPIENHADGVAVAIVDEISKVLGHTKARTRREIPRSLIPPRAVEGMLGHRHQLNVGKT